MHPLARVFQIIFLVAGIFFAGLGYSLFYDGFQQSTLVNGVWTCEVDEQGVQACDVSNLSLNPGSHNEAYVNIVTGGVLMLASGAVAVGGRRGKEKQQAAPAPMATFPGAAPPPPHGAPMQQQAPMQGGY